MEPSRPGFEDDGATWKDKELQEDRGGIAPSTSAVTLRRASSLFGFVLGKKLRSLALGSV
jgi:hypothetical protein